ncbi:MAG TPA: hypothetical protein VKB90_01320 [Candidatus Acidoferrum sp.]|nr:hypothetical protein [Candidatus Acidoferrum sp.]
MPFTLRKMLAEQKEGRRYGPRFEFPEEAPPEPPSVESLAFQAIRTFAPREVLRDDALRNEIFAEQLALVRKWSRL